MSRERARAEKAWAKHNEELRAQHAALRARILALRPGWDAGKLEGIKQSYGEVSTGEAAGLPGLYDLLSAVEAHDALAARLVAAGAKAVAL